MNQQQPIFLTNSQLNSIFNKSLSSLAQIPEEQAESIIVNSSYQGSQHDWPTEEVKESTLDYSLSMVNSGNTVLLMSQGFSRRSPDYFDQYEQQVSINENEDEAVETRSNNELAKLQRRLQELTKEVQALTHENTELKQTNELLQKRETTNELIAELQDHVDQLQTLNSQLQTDLQEAQHKEQLTCASNQRMMSQIKDIFKKQRDLIDENEKLHEQLMKARSDMQQFKCSQQTAEKNHKRALEKLQRENNSLKARLDGELSSRQPTQESPSRSSMYGPNTSILQEQERSSFGRSKLPTQMQSPTESLKLIELLSADSPSKRPVHQSGPYHSYYAQNHQRQQSRKGTNGNDGEYQYSIKSFDR